MHPTQLQYLLQLALIAGVQCQLASVTSMITSLNAAELCGNTSATLSACNFVSSKIDVCYSTHGPPFVSCYCNQEYFNSIFECESEQRLCFENNELDGVMSTLAFNWNSVCGKVLTFTPTTPLVSVLTSTFSNAACAAQTSACAQGSLSLSVCSASFIADTSAYQSCICRPQVISLDYDCEVKGNISCIGRPGDTNVLFGRTLCPNFSTVIQSIQAQQNASASMMASMNSATITASTTSQSTLSISTPVLPGSSSTRTPSPTSSTSKASTGRVWTRLVVWMPVWMTLYLFAQLLASGHDMLA